MITIIRSRSTRLGLNIFILLILQTTLVISSAAFGAGLDLSGYQRPDGAITTHINGHAIDPYFATKALLAAHDAGLDIRDSGTKWIEWALQHQHADGSFDRFCIKNQTYTVCADADADDAMMAVWIELLVKLAPPTGMPPAWKTSLLGANRYLSRLQDKNTGIYFISDTLRVGLLMDNVEVYSAKKAMRGFYSTSENTALAKRATNEAEQLRRDILRVFWQPRLNNFRVSTQKNTKPGFYPDQVAQLYPLMADMATPQNHRKTYSIWMKKNRHGWLLRSDIDYPWGLIALAADKMDDQGAIDCWLRHAHPLRAGQHWNILEETLYQAFTARAPIDNGILSDGDAASQGCASQ